MADLSSLTTNYFATPKEGFTTTLASTIASGATTVPLNSITGYTNGAIATLVVDPTSATAKQTFTGVVDTGGVQLTSVKWTEGTNQTHTAGATVVDYVTATHMAALVKGIATEHNQNGTHGAVTATSLSVSGNTTLTGTTTLVGAMTINSWDGYNSDTDTWVYVSATSFKVTGKNVTAKFPVGTKIKLTQTTAKYFYVTSTSFSTDTTINITGGSDYSLANAAITLPFYSYVATPQGFPTFFNNSITHNGFSVQPTTNVARLTMSGKFATLHCDFSGGTSNATTWTLTLPVPARSAASGFTGVPTWTSTDNGVLQASPGRAYISHAAPTILNIDKSLTGTAWTASGGKDARFELTYEVA